MGAKATPDFSGYATKAGLKCSDGRTIMPDAFKHQDQQTVPLVWQHGHNEPGNVLGHAILEHRADGVYAYGYFNGTEQAKNARVLVTHKDITSLSIYANQLTEKAKQVIHGFIREVSLVLSGANPGALIDNVTIAHADGDMVTLDDEAVIYTGLELAHADAQSEDTDDTDDSTDSEDVAHATDSTDSTDSVEEDGPTVQEVYDSMTSEQKEVVHYMIGAALENSTEILAQSSEDEGTSSNSATQVTVTHSSAGTATSVNSNDVEETEDVEETKEDETEIVHNEEEGRRMSRNVFEQQNGGTKTEEEKPVLTHDAMREIVTEAQRSGSLKSAVEGYALQHGITNIELLFPDAQSVSGAPDLDQRRVEWVSGVLNGTRHSPFSRIKSLVADITVEEARALGYVKGNLKKEEFFGLTKRVTTPTTVYKKQQLDRDDIVDITDFDVVVWLKAEMRLMLDEEIARAVLIGDGRDIASPDKIRDPAGAADGAGIRSIYGDHDLYAHKVEVPAAAEPNDIVDAFITNMGAYKGSGSPTLFTTLPFLTRMLLARDGMDRRMYRNATELAQELGVSNIVVVEVMETETDLLGIVVNLKDYTVGADKGGEINFFDDFDIDYNQYKYLYETRVSGALTKIRSAVVFVNDTTP